MQLLINVIVFLLVADYACGILNNQKDPMDDITLNPKFHCRWFGGSTAKLECYCINRNEEFVIKQNSIPPYDVYSINITDCGKITIGPNAISSMRSLRSFALENIAALELQENSLQWIGAVRNTENIIDFDPTIPSIKLKIANSRIVQLSNNAIKGRINQIELLRCDVLHMAPFAISNLQQNQEVNIYGSTFHNVDAQSFKKFTTNVLIIRDTTFSSLPSRAFYDINVRNIFVLENITISESLKPYGFIINDPLKFELINSKINTISGDGFKMSARGNVLIKNNVFNNTATGAFRGISLNREEIQSYATIRFERDVFNNLGKDALGVDTNGFRAEYVSLQINELCECAKLERYFQKDEGAIDVSCRDDVHSWVRVDAFKKSTCSMLNTKTGMAYIIGFGCALALLALVGGIAVYFWRMSQSKSYGKDGDEKNGKLSMIVPDGRTYRETELHVIVERADLLTTDL